MPGGNPLTVDLQVTNATSSCASCGRLFLQGRPTIPFGVALAPPRLLSNKLEVVIPRVYLGGGDDNAASTAPGVTSGAFYWYSETPRPLQPFPPHSIGQIDYAELTETTPEMRPATVRRVTEALEGC